MTYEETIGLKEKLLKNEILLEKAKELYFADTDKKSWQTKDWRERRDKIIKDKCEICGSVEILTLQHRSHPKKYFEYEKEIEIEYKQHYANDDEPVKQEEFLSHVENNYDYFPVNLCPDCKSRYPNKRIRKTPQYLCRVCKLKFDQPVNKTVTELVAEYFINREAIEVKDKCFVSKGKFKDNKNLYQIEYWLLREKAKEKYKNEIGMKAFLNYLDDNIKYLSFVDTITCCKRCAYHFDIKNMELCPVCKKFYKGVQYPTCIQCLPEDKRKAALEKIEFGKEWRAMHEALGIDVII